MNRVGCFSGLLLVFLVSCTAIPSTVPAVGVALTGTVGPGFTIALKLAEGTMVTTLKEGTYALTLVDQSASHNFHLTGPGPVDVTTTVAETVTRTFDITLVAGTYEYVCDPHKGSMKGSFTVAP